MSERTNITNFLLLSILAAIILVTGSLQCAFDCLAGVDSVRSTFALDAQANRVDGCHPTFEHATVADSCLNKACHQRLPHHRNLGGPEIYRLESLAQPLYSNSRQPAPQYRAGSAISLSLNMQRPELRLPTSVSDTPPQTLASIRTTVLLC